MNYNKEHIKAIEINELFSHFTSLDYKTRFEGEYIELCIRHCKLKNMLDKWDTGELDFEPTNEKSVFQEQLAHIEGYGNILRVRADKEDIDLDAAIEKVYRRVMTMQ